MIDMPDLGDDDDFNAELNRNPVAAMKRCQSDYRQNRVGHRENQWRLIERATLVDRKLQKSPKDRDKLWAEDFFSDRTYKLNPKETLLPCMQYLVGAPTSTSPKYKTASDYACAARILLKQGIKPKDIFAELKTRGGPYKVIEEDKAGDQARDDNAESNESAQQSESGDGGQDSNGSTSPDLTPTAPSAADPSTDGQNETPPSGDDQPPGTTAPKPVRIFNAQKHIAVTGKGYQDRLLTVKPRERRWVLLEWIEDEGEVRRIEVIDMKKEREMRIRSRKQA